MNVLALLTLLLQADDYKVEDGKAPVEKRLILRKDPLAMAASLDGKTLAIGMRERVILASAENGKLLSNTAVFPGAVRGLGFSGDGKHLAVAGMGGVALMETASAKILWKTDGHPGPTKNATGAYGAVIAADRTVITFSMDEPTVRTWAAKDGAAGKTIEPKLGDIAYLAVAPDGGLLAACDSARSVVVFDRDGKVHSTHAAAAAALAFSADGQKLAIGHRIVNLTAKADPVDLRTESKGRVTGIVWLDAQRLASVTERGPGLTVLESGKAAAVVLADFKSQKDMDHALVLLAGGRVAAVASDGVVSIVKVEK